MSDENSFVNLDNSYEEDSSSSLWMWALVFIMFGILMLVGYYYLLYFYDATSIEDAIEKAIKRFNLDTAEERDRKWRLEHGNTGDSGDKYYYDSDDSDDDKDDITFKKVLIKALDNATTEGFSTYDADTSVGTIQKRGTLNWGFIEDGKHCSVAESSECISGDIFPTRDISINPNLR